MKQACHSLTAAEGSTCGPAPSDSVWLPADTFQPVHVWKGEQGRHAAIVLGSLGSFACPSTVQHGLPQLAMRLPPAVAGVHNYTCDTATGNWTHQGWLVNATELKTGKHAGARPAGGQHRASWARLVWAGISLPAPIANRRLLPSLLSPLYM